MTRLRTESPLIAATASARRHPHDLPTTPGRPACALGADRVAETILDQFIRNAHRIGLRFKESLQE
jgi:hypothetical protein